MMKERNAYQISAKRIKYLSLMVDAMIVLNSCILMKLEKHVELILVIQFYSNSFKQQENVKYVQIIHIQMKLVKHVKLTPV